MRLYLQNMAICNYTARCHKIIEWSLNLLSYDNQSSTFALETAMFSTVAMRVMSSNENEPNSVDLGNNSTYIFNRLIYYAKFQHFHSFTHIWYSCPYIQSDSVNLALYAFFHPFHLPSAFKCPPWLAWSLRAVLTVVKFCCVSEEHRFIEMFLLNPLQAHLC